jgi:hypothetical protein
MAMTTAGGNDHKYALRDPLSSGTINESTRLFFENNLLDYNQPITDGFYDCGRSVSSLPSLESLKHQLPHAGREVILLDSREDSELRHTVGKIHATLNWISDRRAQIHVLSLMVSNFYGGSNSDLIANTEKCILDLKTSMWTNVLPIGRLQFGVCRHRAVIFKMIADQTGLPCRLVRGDYISEKGTEGHAWNIVRLDNKHYLCDIMHDPGTLYEDGSEKAEHYKRILKRGGIIKYAGGPGMNSLPLPDDMKDVKLQSEAEASMIKLREEIAIKDIQLERLIYRLVDHGASYIF